MDETATNSLPVETQEQVNIIDQSKINIILIIAATILSYYATDLDKQQLICTVKDNACRRYCLFECFPAL